MTEKVKQSKVEKMEELRKQLADLELEPKQTINGVGMGGETPIEESSDEEVQKPKRERTEKQKQAFIKAQATRLAKAEQRKKEHALKEQEEKEELEKKLIEKAIKVKKKQIKKMAVIEQLSDDDTPIERSAPRPKPQIVPPKPKIRFV